MVAGKSDEQVSDKATDATDPNVDLTKLDWTLRCVTADPDPVEKMSGSDYVKSTYFKMRDFQTQ